MGKLLACFKAYDVRGVVPTELNAEIAFAIGRAYADATGANTVCIGYDIRLSGPELADALGQGLRAAGVEVVDLGLVGTEMVYFATAHYGFDGGMMVTASHNPPEYNGIKMVRSGSRPISGDSGLLEIEERAYGGRFQRAGEGAKRALDPYPDFAAHLLRIVPPSELGPLKVLANTGNGAASLALKSIAGGIPLDIELMNERPDGTFPNGVPNPILPESRATTEDRLRNGDYDFGVAWDGDYDRCFFLDGRGQFIEGYYIVGLLAQAMLQKNQGAAIVYDPRLTWNTLDIVERLGGRPMLCKSGHAFIKEKMREADAVYGGEMSAHHYFKDHWYCDSGILPFLLVAGLVGSSGRSLASLVGEMIEKYPCSGEINSTVEDVQAVLHRAEDAYRDGRVSHVDGVSVEFSQWRFNLRGSNTEPVIRLNVEARGDRALLQEKTDELLTLVRA